MYASKARKCTEEGLRKTPKLINVPPDLTVCDPIAPLVLWDHVGLLVSSFVDDHALFDLRTTHRATYFLLNQINWRTDLGWFQGGLISSVSFGWFSGGLG